MDLTRYSRQTVFPGIGPAGQERLAAGRAVIAGCGALGSVLASLLVRAGVGYVRLLDRDFVELHNLQRQFLYDEADVRAGLPKAIAAGQKLQRINSEVEIEAVVADLHSGNAARLLGECDLVLDAIDNFEGRYLLNDFCVQERVPWIYGAVIGAYGVTMNVLPGETACLRCLFPEAPAPGTVDTCDTAGILGPTVSVIAALQATEALKLLSGARDQLRAGLLQVDLWDGEMQQVDIPRQEACPTCVQGQYDYLRADATSRTTSLCGRDAIQITMPGAARLDLAELAQRLEPLGEVTANSFMLRASLEGYEFNVFADARAIIKGTTDETVARTLYARYIGL